jgi:hypothetical protein
MGPLEYAPQLAGSCSCEETRQECCVGSYQIYFDAAESGGWDWYGVYWCGCKCDRNEYVDVAFELLIHFEWVICLLGYWEWEEGKYPWECVYCKRERSNQVACVRVRIFFILDKRNFIILNLGITSFYRDVGNLHINIDYCSDEHEYKYDVRLGDFDAGD